MMMTITKIYSSFRMPLDCLQSCTVRPQNASCQIANCFVEIWFVNPQRNQTPLALWIAILLHAQVHADF